MIHRAMLTGAFLLALPAAAQFETPNEPHGLPDFTMTAVTAKSSRPFARKDLLGKVWIVDFIFTTCQGQCPTLTAKMRGFQKRLPKEVGFLSFTVDPAHDQKSELRAYARKYGADPTRWAFVTAADSDAMVPLLKDGFGTAYRKDDSASCGFSTAHSAKFALVGPDARVRRMYAGDDSAEMERLEKDAAALAAETTRGKR